MSEYDDGGVQSLLWLKRVGDVVKSGRDPLQKWRPDKAYDGARILRSGTLVIFGVEAGDSVPVSGVHRCYREKGAF